MGSLSIRGLPIRRKLLLLVLLASSLPLSLAIFTMSSRAQELARHDAVTVLQARGDQLASELDSFHTAYLGSTHRLAASLEIQYGAALAAPAIPAPVEANIGELLQVFLQSYDRARNLDIVGSDGRVRISTDSSTLGEDLSSRSYFRQPMRGRGFVSDIFVSGTMPELSPLIAYAEPIVGPLHRVLAVVVLYVRADAFWDTVRAANGRAGPGSFSVLYDQTGVRIAHSFNDDELFRPAGALPPDLINRLVADGRFGERTRRLLEHPSPMPEELTRIHLPASDVERGAFRATSPANGQVNLAVTRKLKTVPWTLFFLAPEASLLAPINSLAATTTVGGALFVLIALGVGVVFANHIIKPIRELSTAATALRAGDLYARVRVESADELGTLATTFNEMAGALRAGQETLGMRVRERTVALERANDELTMQKDQLVAQKEELAIQQEELVRRGMELETASQMKSDFLANMSHELRTPLNAIIGFSEILIDGTEVPLAPVQREHLSLILESGRHLLSLINDILDLSKIEAGATEVSFTPVRPAEAVEAAVLLVDPAARSKRVDIQRQMMTSRMVRADPGKLRQVLLNLLSNAVKFAPHGSTVLVTVESSGGFIKFRVADQGPGIEAGLLSRLFEPFVQGESSLVKKHQGTGLGLAISKRLVELQGGRITVHSTPPDGATFTFTLPIAHEVTVARPATDQAARPLVALRKPIEPRQVLRVVSHLTRPSASSDGGTASTAARTVLVVDDDPQVHQLLGAVLKPAGYRMRGAAGGKQALALVAADPPDILIIDLLMPEMSGFELIDILSSDDKTRALPIIVLTAAELSEAEQSQLRRDVSALALKGNVTDAELLAAVEAAAGRSTPPPERREPGGRSTILVVDDNDMNRELARAILARRGYHVLSANDGEEAVTIATRELPSLILMDLAMPKKDGYTAARELKADHRTAHIPIVALTAMAMAGDEQKAYAAGIDAYVTKPINRGVLEEVITRLLVIPAPQTPS